MRGTQLDECDLIQSITTLHFLWCEVLIDKTNSLMKRSASNNETGWISLILMSKLSVNSINNATYSSMW
jgi:hypothetical protein